MDDFRIRFVRRYDGEKLSEEYSNTFSKIMNAKKVMMWAAISYTGKRTMTFIDGTVNGEAYRKTLIKNLPNFIELIDGRWIFQHDNAKPHIAKPVKNYLNNKKIRVLEWPP